MVRIVALIILIIGIVGGLYLVQHPTIFKPKAYESAEAIRTEKGFQIDTSDPEKVPSKKKFDTLKPDWVRFVYFSDKGVPADIPESVKILLILNNEANDILRVPPTPHGKDIGTLNSDEAFWAWELIYTPADIQEWKNYIDQKYLPFLEEFLKSKPRVDAIQIWSEEDYCHGRTGHCIHHEAYAYMLKKSAEIIKRYNSNIKVIIGGLASQNLGYIQKMKETDPKVFDQVDAVGLHSYGLYPDDSSSEGGWCRCNSLNEDYYCTDNIDQITGQEMCPNILPYGGMGDVIDKYKQETGLAVWITEVGQTSEEEVWQLKYFDKIFKIFEEQKVPVVIWYAWSDKILGPLGKEGADDKWGLVDDYGTIKGVGMRFKALREY